MTLLRLLALGTLLFAVGDSRTILTREGQFLTGEVSRAGNTMVIRTSDGAKHNVTDDDVLILFSDLPQAVSRTEILFENAKRLYEEARALPEDDHLRDEKLAVAQDIIKEVREINEWLTEKYSTSPVEMTTLNELRRLCNDARGSLMDDLHKPDPIALERGIYEAPGQPVERRPGKDPALPLGEGQIGLVNAMKNGDPRIRASAVRRLISPPAPHAIPAVLELLRGETDDDVFRAIEEFMGRMEVVLPSKDLEWTSWMGQSARRRIIVVELLKRTADKGACQALVASILASPPKDNAVRARIASALRKMRDFAGDELKAAYRTAEKDQRVELIKQIGMLRDPKLAGLLTLALTSPPLAAPSTAALIAIGRESVPECVRVIRAGADKETRKICVGVCRKVIADKDMNGADTFELWFNGKRKEIQDDLSKWWMDQANRDYPVNPDDFGFFELKVDDIIK